MTGRFDHEVIIAGAGPAGLTLANLLGLYGIDTLVLEQNASTVHEPRAVSIDDESLRTLQLIGLIGPAIARMAPGYGSIYLDPKRRPFAAVHPVAEEFGWPKRNAFRQPVLEAQLAEGARARPGVALRFETTILEHHDDGECVSVTTEHGGERRVLRARYLIGCDGGRSRTRRAIGATLGGSSFEEKWLILDTSSTTDPNRHTHVFSDPYRPALSLPGPDRTRRYEIRLRPGEDPAEMETEARARELIAWYGGDPAVTIDRRVVYTFQARIADHWRRGRVFLCGDAAHLTPPFAGQGMNAGIRDVSNLAWKLAAVLRGQLGEGLLDSYQTERRDHAWSMIQLAVNLGVLISPHGTLRSALIRLAVRAMGLVPAWKDWLVQMRYKPRPRFDAGFVLRDAAIGAELPGRMFPQPRVETVPGTVLRLDELLGTGFSALVCAADPPALWARVAPHLPALFTASIVAILPDRIAFSASAFPPGVAATFARDLTGSLFRALAPKNAAAGPLPEAVVLLRPDRYVAAVITADGAPAQGRQLARMLEESFAGQAEPLHRAA